MDASDIAGTAADDVLQVAGLPLHPLIVHAVVVLTPLTVAAGESLAEWIGPVPAVERHEELGEMLLPWAIALFVVAAAQWAWFRFGEARMRRRSPGGAVAVRIGLAVASVVVAVGTLVVLVLIGDSGARAVWGGLLE